MPCVGEDNSKALRWPAAAPDVVVTRKIRVDANWHLHTSDVISPSAWPFIKRATNGLCGLMDVDFLDAHVSTRVASTMHRRRWPSSPPSTAPGILTAVEFLLEYIRRYRTSLYASTMALRDRDDTKLMDEVRVRQHRIESLDLVIHEAGDHLVLVAEALRSVVRHAREEALRSKRKAEQDPFVDKRLVRRRMTL